MHKLCEMLNIEFPVIMAPMFLVTNEKMMEQAIENGIAGCIPALNIRETDDLRAMLERLRAKYDHGIGVNLIVNKSNIKYKEQLDICVDVGIDFFITSLGNPKEVIERSKEKGIKVFCDVVDVAYAKKVEALGADALIAVNSGAGGHAGNIPASILIPMLKKECNIPVISAGGVGDGRSLLSMFALGAEGASIGSPFIATIESDVSKGYKDACVDFGAKDIALTSKLSGTPCTVIKTPYVEKIGTDQNLIEGFLNKNRQIKKYAKMLTFYKGMKLLEKAAFSATYKTIWCAGPSIEFTNKTRPIKDIVGELRSDYEAARKELLQELQ